MTTDLSITVQKPVANGLHESSICSASSPDNFPASRPHSSSFLHSGKNLSPHVPARPPDSRHFAVPQPQTHTGSLPA